MIAETALVSCTVTEHSFQFYFFQVWENEGNCSAPKGKKGSINQVLKLGEKIIRKNETCFNELVNGVWYGLDFCFCKIPPS